MPCDYLVDKEYKPNAVKRPDTANPNKRAKRIAMANTLRVISQSGTTFSEEKLISVIQGTVRNPADIKLAVEHLTERERPDFFKAALVLEHSGDKEGAREFYLKYVKQHDVEVPIKYPYTGPDFFGTALVLERLGDNKRAKGFYARYAEQQYKIGHYMLAARVYAIDLGDIKEATHVYYKQAKRDREIGRTAEAEALENELAHGRLPALTFGDNIPRLLRDKN
jgi:hypothetical protein